jgi:hypothetical protein
MLLSDRNTLNFRRKFFCARSTTVLPIGQKIALLISQENFRVFESAPFNDYRIEIA